MRPLSTLRQHKELKKKTAKKVNPKKMRQEC